MQKKTLKEIAKFAAGVTAWESIVHFSLAKSGNIPITFWGFTLTESINTIQIILPAACTLILIYYAWIQKQESPNCNK